MLVDYDSLVNELSSVLSKCRLTAHRARVKALSTLLQGLLLLCEASLSGMGRGATLLDERKTFSGQLKRAFRFLNNPQFDPWEVRSEEHTSELQSQSNLVCRLLLEKKKKQS